MKAHEKSTATMDTRAGGRVRLVVFAVAGARFGLELAAVARVIRAVAVRAVADLPEVVAGVVDLHGELIPVFDVRRRLGLPARAIGPDDQFLGARAARRTVALVVDAVEGVSEFPADTVLPAAEIARDDGGMVAGVVTHAAGMVVIYDLEKFLAEADAGQLGRVLAELANTPTEAAGAVNAEGGV